MVFHLDFRPLNIVLFESIYCSYCVYYSLSNEWILQWSAFHDVYCSVSTRKYLHIPFIVFMSHVIIHNNGVNRNIHWYYSLYGEINKRMYRFVLKPLKRLGFGFILLKVMDDNIKNNDRKYFFKPHSTLMDLRLFVNKQFNLNSFTVFHPNDHVQQLTAPSSSTKLCNFNWSPNYLLIVPTLDEGTSNESTASTDESNHDGTLNVSTNQSSNQSSCSDTDYVCHIRI
eukprot:666380_1